MHRWHHLFSTESNQVSLYAITGSKALVAGANALVLFVAARFMQREEFGIFSAILGASVLAGRMLLLGCEYGYIRLRTTPELRSREGELAAAAVFVVAGGSLVSGLVTILLLACGFATSAVAAAVLFASVGWACTELGYWIFLGQDRVWRAMLAQGGTVSGRAGAVAAALLLSTADSHHLGALAYGFSGFLLGCVALAQAASTVARKFSWNVLRKLIGYSVWQGVAQGLTTLSVWFGAFALLIAGKPAESGQYSLALTVTAGVLTLCYGMGEYLILRIAHLPGAGQLGHFVREAFVQTAKVGAGCIAILTAIAVVVPHFFPAGLWRNDIYLPLCVSLFLVLFHAPLEAAAHFLLKPQLGFANKIIRLGCVIAAGSPAAVFSGPAALGWVQAGSVALGFIYLALAVRAEWVKQLRRSKAAAAAIGRGRFLGPAYAHTRRRI